MSKHTPGPWRTDENDHDAPYQNIRIEAEKNRTVCIVWVDDAPDHAFNAEQEANARLIAAAPDLLDALKAASNYIDTLGGVSQSYRTAIDKAKGESK